MTRLSPLLLLTVAGIPLAGRAAGTQLDGKRCAGTVSLQQAYTPQPGDILLFRTRNIYVNLAYVASCSGGVTHCALVVRSPNGSLGLLETPGRRYPVMISDIPSRLQFYDGKVWVRRRRILLTAAESAALSAFACAQASKRFNVRGLLGPVFHKPVRRENQFCIRSDELDRPRWFCSELLAAALVSAGLLDGCVARPGCTNPEDLRGDQVLDLSAGWEPPVPWYRCGARGDGWWSEDGEGRHCWWH